MSENNDTSARLFFREVSCAVDKQGRITFPKAWKLPDDDENTVFMLCPGLSRSIHVYDYAEFQKSLMKIRMAPKTEEIQNWITIYSGRCQRVTLDKQGRFAIDPQLMQYAEITDEVDCIGAIDYGRIFNPDRWKTIRRNNKPEPPLTPEQEEQLSDEEKDLLYIKKAIDFISTLPAT